MRHLLTLFDLTSEEFHDIQKLADHLKASWKAGCREPYLQGQTLALLFEKPSLRTRVSFEAGVTQLGGTPLYLTQDVGWQQREMPSDFIRVLGEYCHYVVCRTFSHETIVELASFDCVPIINGLTDRAHPCQAMADIMTMREAVGDLKGKQLTFVGDGNNVARSVLHACGLAGMKFRLLGPTEYHIEQDWLDQVSDDCEALDARQSTDAASMLKGADFVYTDVWTSMGQEDEAKERQKDFADFQVNASLMSHTPNGCKVLHCLPAHRGEEITHEVIESLQSLVIPQAGNRMHLQKGLLAWLAVENKQLDRSRLVFD